MIGVGLAVFQQITGINAIIYYANEIFGAAGFETPQEQAAATTWAVGAVNVLATFIAVAYVDRFGRKPLLLTGLVGMAVSLTVVGFCFLSLDDAARAAGESMAGIAFVWIKLRVPETKGKTLEEIEQLWEPERAPAVATQLSP